MICILRQYPSSQFRFTINCPILGAAEATGLGFVCFVVINPCVLAAKRVDFGIFLFYEFSNFTPIFIEISFVLLQSCFWILFKIFPIYPPPPQAAYSPYGDDETPAYTTTRGGYSAQPSGYGDVDSMMDNYQPYSVCFSHYY